MAKCPIIIRAGLKAEDVTTCLEPSVPDTRLRTGEWRFLCKRHLGLFREGHLDLDAEIQRPYDEAVR